MMRIFNIILMTKLRLIKNLQIKIEDLKHIYLKKFPKFVDKYNID